MESNNVQSKKKSYSLYILLFAILTILLFSLIGVGYLGWKQVSKKNQDEIAKVGDDQGVNNPKPTEAENFTSDVVANSSGNIVDLVNKVSPAVATVISKGQVTDIFSEETQEVQRGVGTGFFISEDGLLITNEHVVCESSSPKSLTVIGYNNKSYKVETVAVDSVLDIAILKVDTNGEKVTTLKFANPNSKVQVGQDVIAIGNPLGVNPGSVTRGIISGVGRNIRAQGSCNNKLAVKEYSGVYQTDAAINSGNSGGPLINLNGEVVGVNSATSSGANNISYAVPSNRVLELLDKYQKGNGEIKSPFIGVEYTMIDENLAKSNDLPAGALIRKIVPGSPAEKAGLKRGDIITKLGDKKLEFSLQTVLNQYFEPNQTVKAEVYRSITTNILSEDVKIEGRYVNLEITLGER